MKTKIQLDPGATIPTLAHTVLDAHVISLILKKQSTEQ